jgi:hypothetical protein
MYPEICASFCQKFPLPNESSGDSSNVFLHDEVPMATIMTSKNIFDVCFLILLN